LEETAKDDVILSFELKLNSLAQRIAELEQRLRVLERSPKSPRVNPQPKLGNPSPRPVKSLRGKNYLERMIEAARREYERERTQ